MRTSDTLFLLLVIAMAALSQSRTKMSVAKGMLLVANKGEQTLGMVDVDAGRQIATVPENGITGHEVAASPDGRLAYVPIYGNSGVGILPGPGQLNFDAALLKTTQIAEGKVLQFFGSYIGTALRSGATVPNRPSLISYPNHRAAGNHCHHSLRR